MLIEMEITYADYSVEHINCHVETLVSLIEHADENNIIAIKAKEFGVHNAKEHIWSNISGWWENWNQKSQTSNA